MTTLTRFQYVALARLLARDLSGEAMKIDCRSLTGLRIRGLVEYVGRMIQGEHARHEQAFTEKTAGVTDAGRGMVAIDRRLYDEIRTHLRLECKRANERASSYEATAKVLRRRSRAWDSATVGLLREVATQRKYADTYVARLTEARKLGLSEVDAHEDAEREAERARVSK